MAGNGSVPAYLQADLAAGLPAVRLSPEVERLLYESAGPSGSSNPLGGLPASPPRPPTSASAAAPSSPTDALASRSAGLPRPGSSSALPLGAGGPNATAPLPSASAAGAATGARSAQPMAGAAQPPVKESRRTVLSHDEEVPEWDFASSFNFVTFGLFSKAEAVPNKVQQAAQDAYWIVTGSLDNSVGSWVVSYDGQQQGEGRIIPLKTPVLSVCLLHAGVVGCGTPSGAIKVIQPHGAMAFSSLEGHKGPVTGLAKLTGGRVASCSEDKTLKVFGTRVAVCESTIEPPASHAPRCIAGLPSGQIVAGCEDGNVRVYNPGVADSIWTFKGHKGPVLSVAGLDEVRAASGGSDGTVRLWRVTQVDAERSLTGHNCPVTAVCAVTLARLVSGGEDGNLRLWRASDGACLRVFSGHTGAVTAIALTPDTLRICSVSKDRTCRLWRENSPADEPPVILEGHDDEVTSIAVGMQWESLTPSDRFQAKRGCSRLC